MSESICPTEATSRQPVVESPANITFTDAVQWSRRWRKRVGSLGTLAAGLLCLSATTPVLAKTAEEVIGANLKAIGGEASFAKQPSVILQGTAVRQTFNRNFTWTLLYPQSFREDAVVSGLTQTTVVTGSDGWARALNGVSTRLQGPELEQSWLMGMVLGFGYLKGDELELTYGTPAPSSDGKRTTLTVTARKMPAVELTFDNASSLLAQASFKTNTGTCSLVVEDHRKVGTLKMPFKVTEACTFGSLRDEPKYEVKQSDIKTTVEESQFERTSDPSNPFKFPESQSSARPAFKYDADLHLPLIQARLNDGEPRWFLFDATLPYSLIDKGLADSLKLTALDSPLDLVRQASVPLFLLNKLSLGEATLSKTAVTLGAMPQVATGLKEPIAGVLGRELLEHLTLELDYSGNALTVYNPSAFTDRGTAESLRVDEFGRVNALFNGQTLLSVWLATANPGTVKLPLSVLEQEKLLPAEGKRLPAELVGVSGLGEKDGAANIGSYSSVQLGQLAINNVLAAFPTQPGPANEEPALGNQVLERFKLTFDLIRQQVLVEQSSGWSKTWSYNRSGIKFKAGDGLIVESLLPGADATLMVGDQLVGIQNAGAWSRDLHLIRERLREPAGTRLKFKVKRAGKELEKDFELRELL